MAFRVLVYLREETDYAEKYGDEARSDDPDAARRAFVKDQLTTATTLTTI